MASANIITISAVSMGGIGFALAMFLAFADKKLRVKEDPRVARIADMLPGTNCGGCGYPGCQVLAEQLIAGNAPPNACVAGGKDIAVALAGLLGVEVQDHERQIAVVLCNGGDAEAERMAVYRGYKTCTAADIVRGDKSCVYGCLGYGECVDACKFDSMAMSDNGLPVVFHDKCVGCGACAKACPRDIIEMHPEDHKLFVYCRNKDKGAVAKKSCKVACIACTLCTKGCSVEGGVVMKDNLATVNYELAPQNDESTKKCPTKCILFGVEERMTRAAFYASKTKKAG